MAVSEVQEPRKAIKNNPLVLRGLFLFKVYR